MKANMGLQACNTNFLLPVILDNHGMLRADQSFLIVLTLWFLHVTMAVFSQLSTDEIPETVCI